MACSRQQPKEGCIGAADRGAEEAERDIGALQPSDFGYDEGGAKPEGICLGGQEEEDGIVLMPGDGVDQQLCRRCVVPGDLTAAQEAGEGDGEGHSDDLPVPSSERCGVLELLEEGLEEGEGNR